MMYFDRSVPVLQVADVAKSIAWYSGVLGFSADPFPASPPYAFAILRREKAEIMLQRARGDTPPPRTGWAVYLRLKGGRLLEFAEAVRKQTPLLRGPERMPYGQVEFEVSDPDGYRLCVGEPLDESVTVPPARE